MATLANSPEVTIVATDDVAPAENDAYLSIFSHQDVHDPEAAHWFRQWLSEEVNLMGKPAKVEDLDDMMDKLNQMIGPEKALRSFTPEQRLAGLSMDELRDLLDEIQRRVSKAG